MTGKKMKLSIIIPTKNTLIYLKDNVSSIINQEYDDFELIISDNHSEDGTYEWVQSLNNPHIKLIKPEFPLVMSEHWDFALSHANGEWIQILGADDGVQPFYFQLADFFINMAEKKKISIINSRRAYFFWEGCQDIYSDRSVNFLAHAGFTVKSTKYAMLSTLIGNELFFNIPQLYTMSIIHHSVIEKVKKELNNSFFCVCATSPDVSSSVSVCSVEDKYLHSFIPLTWVGTSTKSQGYPSNSISYKEKTKKDFERVNLKWHSLMGIMDDWLILIELHFYYYEALLQHEVLQSPFWRKVFYSKWFKILLFSNVLASIVNSQEKIECLKSILTINKITFKRVVFCCYSIIPCVRIILRLLTAYSNRKKIFFSKKLQYITRRSAMSNLSLMDAYRTIEEIEKKNNFIYDFIRKHSTLKI